MEELKGAPELVSGQAPALGEPCGPRGSLFTPPLLLCRNLLFPFSIAVVLSNRDVLPPLYVCLHYFSPSY